jgi:hypothetical protein
MVNIAVRNLPVWGNLLVQSGAWGGPLQSCIIAIVLGGLMWGFHWFRMAKGDIDSSLRQVYIYLLAIVVSAVSGLTALVVGLYQILVWIMGAAGTSAGYFQFLGWVIPTLIVTTAVWAYHQSVAREESASVQERRLSSKRIHLYIMSFLSLGTLTAGLIILVGTVLNLIINSLEPAIIMGPGWWQKQLSLSLALLVVAVPLWWYYWKQITSLVAANGAAEGQARSRRIYLYVIIGASIITLAADLVNIVYQFLGGTLTGHFDIHILQQSRLSIQSLFAAIPLLIYHWQIARQDQRRGAESADNRKIVTILSDSPNSNLAEQLSQQDLKVRVLEYSGAPGIPWVFTDANIQNIKTQVEAAAGQKVMLVVHEGQYWIMPFKDK